MNAVMDAMTIGRLRKPGKVARGVAPIFHRLLDRIDAGLLEGAIEASLPDGTRRLIGGHAPGPRPIVVVHRWRSLVRLAMAGSIGWYEGWEAGDWSSPNPVPLFDLFMRNRVSLGQSARSGGLARLSARLGHYLRPNNRQGARRNIAEHYDLGNDFYKLWLDDGMTYSAAMFTSRNETLAVAQDRKLAAILERTATTAGDHILEIGCGWGSFAKMAAAAGRSVHGVTLSRGQKTAIEAAGCSGVTVALTDYRDVTGTYDAVASIEMVEAVGERWWPTYLDTIARVLKPGGRAAIQYISIADDIFPAYARSVDFVQRHVFPGGMLISRDRFRRLADQRGFAWRDEQTFGQDYAETLLRWRRRFDEAVAQGRLPARFDARFVRLWRYYLMYCEGGFRGGGIDVAQVTLVKT